METNGQFQSCALRVLGFIDRNPLSKTAGCADRNYWHYQDGKGFFVGSFQVAMLGLRAAAEAFPDHAQAYEDASRLACQWWAKQILNHGALDEYFAGQQSFCATAYTCMAAGIWSHFEIRANRVINQDIRQALNHALKILQSDLDRPESANQSLAAHLAWDVCIEAKLMDKECLQNENPFSIPRDSKEGWLNEYGGFDLGYSLKCLDLCALAMCLLQDPSRRNFYENLAIDLLHLLHNIAIDFTFSPALGSRGNPQRLLGGLRLFDSRGHVQASELLAAFTKSQRFASLIPAEFCDDKYLVFFHLTSLMLEYCAQSTSSETLRYFSGSYSSLLEPNRMTEKSQLYLKNAGLLFLRSGDFRVAFYLKRGGAMHVETSKSHVTEAGYLIAQGEEYWGPGMSDVEVKITKYGHDELMISLPLMVCKISNQVKWVQNWFFSLALKVCLKIPLLGKVTRSCISQRKKRVDPLRVMGERRVIMSTKEIILEDHFKGVSELVQIYRLGEWILTDGHATRMSGNAQIPFEKIDLSHERIRRSIYH